MRRDLLVPVEKRTADVRPPLRDLEGKRNREVVDHDRGVPHAGKTLRVAELDAAEDQQDHSDIPNGVRAEKRGDIHDGWSLPSNLLDWLVENPDSVARATAGGLTTE